MRENDTNYAMVEAERIAEKIHEALLSIVDLIV